MMCCTTFMLGTFRQKLPTLLSLYGNENLLLKTAVKHGIPGEWAKEYTRREIEAKRCGL